MKSIKTEIIKLVLIEMLKSKNISINGFKISKAFIGEDDYWEIALDKVKRNDKALFKKSIVDNYWVKSNVTG